MSVALARTKSASQELRQWATPTFRPCANLSNLSTDEFASGIHGDGDARPPGRSINHAVLAKVPDLRQGR